MKRIYLLILVGFLISLLSCQSQSEKSLQSFIHEHTAKVEPLQKRAALAYWNAATTGDEKYYKEYGQLDLEIRRIYASKQDFEFLKQLRQENSQEDGLLKRQLDVLYLSFLENQAKDELLKEIVELSTKIEQTFSTFRGSIDGHKVSASEIDEILKKETDSLKRKQAWLASKQVGEQVSGDIIRLVKLRNQLAQNLGYENYHTFTLATGEQDVETITEIFSQLYELTNEPFAELKKELDGILAEMYGVGVGGLMPWHYHDPFFQETPLVYDLDLDTFYKDENIKDLAEQFYFGIGLPVESILQNSDLYERDKKNPHAFCIDIDRQGDVRILCNITPTERWMETTLHELGHAVYDKYHDPDLPYLLREPAHAFTTEAVAMFFGRLSREPEWMMAMLNLNESQVKPIAAIGRKYARLKQLIFARWAMVMFEFEKQLYADPDQDLNSLWWKTVSKFQLVKPPANRTKPDWAAKIHFTIAPCYYHNYLLGELFASQLHHTLKKSDSQIVDNEKLGDFMRAQVFEPGNRFLWSEMITRATGEPLTPEYFVEQYVNP
ncbi:peptidase M3A and M3B thimet/oligopeptidase F [candidate division KSB1 bacterium]|nr:peptidase M3A and M3B thimet/oligopeptidase F [candidate division KSB1 bacterium]